MKNETLYLTAAGLAAFWILMPVSTEAGQGLSINFFGEAETCADVKVRSDGQLARDAQTFALARNEVSVLEVSGLSNANIHVRGWDQAGYRVEACRIAAAANRAGAENLLRNIAVTRSGARFSASGPASGENSRWSVIFIVHAPRGAALDLETKNGPIEVRNVQGTTKARVTNGPVAFRDSSGTIEAHSANGPIAFSGGSGDVRLTATNGPIAVKVDSEDWNGPQLVVSTSNGPLSVAVPGSFRSGVRLEMSYHAPVRCAIDACSSAQVDSSGSRRVMELNGRSAVVRLSTGNGPVSVGQSGRARRFI